MTRSLLLTGAGALLLLAGAASAQTVEFPQGPRGIAHGLRITVSMSLSAPASADTQKHREIQEQLRVAHYEIANTECARLSAVFNQDCALVSLSIQAVSGRHGPQQETITSSANAQFQLTKR